MQYRKLGRTGFSVSTVSFGAWAIGGTWGKVDDQDSLRALHAAVDRGVNFFDTADVYGDGRSERLIAELKRSRKQDIIVATKAGRRLQPHVADGYNRENLTRFVERSLRNLGTEAIDLLQLHCPPTDVYYRPEVFGILDDLVTAGKIRFYGVSVERVEEALKAIEFERVQSVQIIFNLFRQRPADHFLSEAARRQVGVLARLPLSSGVLAGKITLNTSFEPDDHRAFNRHGEAFDRGETFSGIELSVALEAVQELRQLLPQGLTMAQMALAFVLSNPGVTCVIPGAKRESQVDENAAAADRVPLPNELLERSRAVYDRKIRALVHHYW